MSGPNRVALVTGGAARVGRAIVAHLASRGWSVAFTYRSSGRAAETLRRELEAEGRSVLALAADLDDARTRRALVDETLAHFGRLDALVNNAAVFPRTDFAALDEAELLAVLRTNLVAPVMLAHACADALRASRGSVVNLLDVLARRPIRGHLPYLVSKAALEAATQVLAVELAPEARANGIAPGIALFPEAYDEATRRRLVGRTPLGRAGSPEEIARAVEYLLEGAPTMTGQVLVIDAGRSL
ncbi:MAG TPA: SDR family oxidoreductase [Thermoanaerobaculaceae bacterium]|nr:SDR family oxidoreductase [Thermoanaerobaculaceae bacterium]HRS17190.1 SDR family oxidoreductase [Thermoanaerobaculaceae bacterium]